MFRFSFPAGLALFIVSSASLGATVFLPYAKFPPIREDTWYYPQAVASLHLKSLFDYPANVDVYRFFDAGWDGPCLIGCIIKNGSRITFTGVECGGLAGYSIQSPIASETRLMSAQEWQAFQSLFQESGFGNGPHYIDRPIIDGYEDIVEARIGGHYEYRIREVPDAYPEDQPFYKLSSWVSMRIKTAQVSSLESQDDNGVATRDNTPVLTGH